MSAIDLRAGVGFALMENVVLSAFRRGIELHGSATAAFHATGTVSQRRQALSRADETLAKARAAAAAILLQGEPDYPDVLLHLPDAPRMLFASGDVTLLDGPRVGIVGTRHSSPSGDRIAHQLASVLARAGAAVVSGMALGIDAAAHRGALAAGGRTIAVLGGGADVPYPAAHRDLHAKLVKHGLVLSEAPLGSRPGKGAFPRRNRIIAALSDVLIVVEAGERSGALITARIALELGRTVAAVPGPIDSPRHVGSNNLLHDGASFIRTVDDVLAVAGIDNLSASDAPDRLGSGAVSDGATDSSYAAILNAVRAGASDVEDIARNVRLPAREFASALSALELAGQLELSPGGAVSLPARS